MIDGGGVGGSSDGGGGGGGDHGGAFCLRGAIKVYRPFRSRIAQIFMI